MELGLILAAIHHRGDRIVVPTEIAFGCIVGSGILLLALMDRARKKREARIP